MLKKCGCKGCYYYEKTADEMFEKLGYMKNENVIAIDYVSTTVAMGETFHCIISFKKKSKLIEFGQLIMPEEIKAINKKCKELGWI